MKQPVILNDDGKPVLLNAKEKMLANYWERHIKNSLGYEVPITTLTTISKRISQQKFFELAPADYLPVVVGEGAWTSNITTYRSFLAGDIFESGIINTGVDGSRLSVADAAVDALNIKVLNWAKEINYTVFDLQMAAQSGNFDLIAAKEKARKVNWDLGIQRVAFLGARPQNNSSTSQCLGLFNQVGVKIDTTTITKAIGSMSYTELSALQQALIQNYRSNCNYTAYPTHFVIPETDYNSLAAQSSPQFPVKSILQLLEEGFQVICRNPNFKILPNAYASVANAGSGVLPAAFSTQMYTLLKYDEESLKMEIPLDYTNTLANSLNNFNFSSAAYGQFTGVLVLRPLELYYLGF